MADSMKKSSVILFVPFSARLELAVDADLRVRKKTQEFSLKNQKLKFLLHVKNIRCFFHFSKTRYFLFSIWDYIYLFYF